MKRRDNPYFNQVMARNVRANYLGAAFPRAFIGPIQGGRNPRPRRLVGAVAERIRARAGFTRTGGFYGRYGQSARDAGLVPELKFFDNSAGLAITFDTTPEITTGATTGALNLIPQGDTESTRDGRECTVTSIQIKGVMTFTPGAGAQASGVVYMYLILDQQANGAYPAVGDVFNYATVGNAGIMMNNLANNKRFKTLKKWVVPFNPPAGATTAYNNVTKNIDFFQSCNIPLNFSSTTGAIAEIRSNNLVMAFGSSGTGIDDTVTFSGLSRLRFRG